MGVRTGDGEAKSVRVICKETLEYGRFTRTGGTRYYDWTVDLGRYQVESLAATDFCSSRNAIENTVLPEGAIVEWWSEGVLNSGSLLHSDDERVGAA